MCDEAEAIVVYYRVCKVTDQRPHAVNTIRYLNILYLCCAISSRLSVSLPYLESISVYAYRVSTRILSRILLLLHDASVNETFTHHIP